MERRIIAVALVTEAELKLLGRDFKRAFRIDETPCFGELLHAIDDADRAFRCRPEHHKPRTRQRRTLVVESPPGGERRRPAVTGGMEPAVEQIRMVRQAATLSPPRVR